VKTPLTYIEGFFRQNLSGYFTTFLIFFWVRRLELGRGAF